MTRLSVIGRSCRLPGVDNVAAFWDLLVEGRCTVTKVPEGRFSQAWYLNPRRGEPGKAYTFAAGVIDDIWGFDPGIFSITPREARQMDPQQRLLLKLVWEALEDAGVPPSSIAGQRIGVYVGASSMDYSHRQFFDPAGTDSYLMTGNTLSLISNRVSYIFDLKGPSLTIDTACSSSLVALDYAAQDLKSGRIDTAIVGGVNALLSPFNFMGFCAASMLSPDGLCRPFDHRGNGYVRAEGGVVMILQREDAATVPAGKSYGSIIASGMNADGRTSGVALPSSDQQAALLETLYETFEIDPNHLAFVEAHGTGTLVGDPAEAGALGRTLGQRRRAPLPIGSAKSNVGHLEPASGIVGLLKAQLALEHGLLPRSLHVEKLNPHIPFDDLNLTVATDAIPLEASPAAPLRAGVNNFGFGGTNVHVVIEAAAKPASAVGPEANAPTPINLDSAHRDPAASDLLMVSAHCPDGLRAQAANYARTLRQAERDGISHRAIAAATAHRRERLPERLVVSGRTAAEIAETLERFAGGDAPASAITARAAARDAKTALVFSGNGAQWDGMGRAAFESSATFRHHFRAVDDHYRRLAGDRLEALLFAEDLIDSLVRTEIAQPLLFAIQVALARTLQDQGLVFAATLGHSVGEVAAAHIAGSLDLAQAVAVIRARSHHQELAAGQGLMAAVQTSAADTAELIRESGLGSVEIAALNSPRSVTVSGAPDDIRAFAEHAGENRIATRILDINYPFHSARLDPVRAPLLETLTGLEPGAATHTMYSTVTGAKVAGEALGPAYWWDNVRQPVQFDDAVRTAAEDGIQVFIEIGPRPILAKYIADATRNTDLETAVVASLDAADTPADDPLRRALARALAAGATFDRTITFGRAPDPQIVLPAYPWQDQDYLFQISPEALDTFNTANRPHPLLGLQLRPEDYVWDSHLDTGMVPFLADHAVAGKPIMPGTGYVEMALTAAAQHLATTEIELRDFDFVQALELHDEACQAVRTRIDIETHTVEISSRPRLTEDDRQTHARSRFARIPTGDRPALTAPSQQTDGDAPILDHIYRLAEKFGLDYGPAFQRVTACREIGDEIIEVELSAPDEDATDSAFILHPVDFDACFHGLNVVYERLVFGETKLAYVPVHLGRLRVIMPGQRIASARIHLKSYNTRAVRAGFELFARDGSLIAIAENVRFRASSLVHRLSLAQAAYHVDHTVHPLPLQISPSAAPDLTHLLGNLQSASLPETETDTTRHDENRLLLDMAARRAAFDAVTAVAGPDRVIDLALNRKPLSECGSDNDNIIEAKLAAPLPWRRDDTDCRAAMANLLALLASADLATSDGDDALWHLVAPDACPLPPLDEIVTAILEEDPSWSAECIMLLNATQHLKRWLAIDETGADGALPTQGDNAPATETTPAISDVYSLSLIEQFMTATPAARVRITQIAALVAEAIRHWPEGRPLRILQLGASAGGLTRALEPLLETARDRNTRAHLVIADTDGTWSARIASLYARTPGIDTVHVDATLDALDAFAPFDLVVSADGLHGLENISVLLANLKPRLADGAIAAVTELQPSAFHDVIFAGTRGWFDTNHVAGIAHGRLREKDRWTSLLESAGFTAQGATDLGALANTNLILAHAEAPAASTASTADDRPDHKAHQHQPEPDATSAAAPPPAAPVLILTGDNTSNPTIAATLQDQIASSGRVTKLVAPDTVTGILDELDPSGTRPEIVFISASEPASRDPQAELLDATSRLTSLLKDLANRPARLWIIAVGGARALADLGPADPVRAGVWGYARSALNEYPDRDIRIVDIAAALAPDAAAARLDAVIANPPQHSELIVAPDAIHGLEVRRGAPPPSPRPAPSGNAAAMLDQATVLELTETGDLDALTWVARDRRAPAPGEVEIEVTATGLNFRDVMWSLGLLPEEALEDGFAGPTVGFECAGRIVRVGDDIEDFSPGDRVMAMAPACFASHVTVTSDAVARLPDNVALEDAATIPVAFLTAHYALDHLANLRSGEWVLIHGAAGGVGLAAIQIARRLGARIIATAGSDEKRNLLRALGADHVLDTRSLEFADEVRRITDGGVDVALNSLAGEAMERTIELMRPFGRFLELGKRDFYANTKIALRPFRRNVSYHGIDADQLLTYRPEVVRRVFAEIIEGFADGTFTALPYRTFPAASVVDAFRLMQKSGHIGKIVVEAPQPTAGTIVTKREFTARADATHIIVGGTGGFGLELARWLADRGARHILLTSRTGKAKGDGADALDQLRANLARRDISLDIAVCDATNPAALDDLLTRTRAQRPIAGIALTAMVLDDGAIENLTPERIETVLAPKVTGAANLDRLTRDDHLDYFLLFSSAATLFGNPGQASYTAANGYLDGLARVRAAAGLKAISVAWGAISDVGVLTREADAAQSLARHIGGIDFKARDGLNLLAHLLVREDCDTTCANVALATMNWSVAADMLPIVRTPAYALIRREAATGHGDRGDTVDIRAAILGLNEDAARAVIAGYLAREVAAIFRMPVEDISLKRSLADIGMDSLMGLELRMAAQRGLGIDLPVVSISDGTTINDIAARVLPRLRGSQETGDETPRRDTLIDKHVSEEIDEAEIAQLERRVTKHEAGLKKVV